MGEQTETSLPLWPPFFFLVLTRTSKKTVQFSREIKSPCRYHSSKNNKIRERVDSRVRYIWRLRLLTKAIFFFLGYVIDSVKTAFLMPLDKKITFASLRERLLSHKTVSLKSRQKFVGKINSFTLVVLAARLYSGVSCLAMSKASKSCSHFPRLKGGSQAPALP